MAKNKTYKIGVNIWAKSAEEAWDIFLQRMDEDVSDWSKLFYCEEAIGGKK